jgi:hypothetical protein
VPPPVPPPPVLDPFEALEASEVADLIAEATTFASWDTVFASDAVEEVVPFAF